MYGAHVRDTGKEKRRKEKTRQEKKEIKGKSETRTREPALQSGNVAI
jgi:hypothetical protein